MELGDVSKLIDRARNGDAGAVGEIIERLRPHLVRRAKYELDSRVYARCDPSDVVQVTCLELHRDFHAFQGVSEGELVAWVKRILHHNVANTVRRHVLTAKRSTKRERSLNDSVGEGVALIEFLIAPIPTPGEKVQCSETHANIERVVQQLPRDQRDAVRLRHLEGYSLKELAVHFGRSEDAVAGLLKRGMRNLRAIMPSPEDSQ